MLPFPHLLNQWFFVVFFSSRLMYWCSDFIFSLSQEEATSPAQVSGRKRTTPATDGTENSVASNPVAASQPPPNKPRRGRPPKNPAAAANKEKEVTTTPGSGAGRGRKRAAPSQDSTSTASAEPISVKIPKQKESDSKRAGQQRQIDLQR